MKAGGLVLLGALAAGAVLRVLGGVPLLRTELVALPRASGLPAAGTPEQAVESFYGFLQGGRYAEAWKVSVEPAWPESRGASYGREVRAGPRPASWTTQADFVRRYEEELGAGLKLNGIEAVRLAGPPDSPEARAASTLRPARLYGVRATGHMLGACLIYRWDRDLAVAEIDGAFRVVLPGAKAARASFHEAWFSNLALIGSLRGDHK